MAAAGIDCEAVMGQIIKLEGNPYALDEIVLKRLAQHLKGCSDCGNTFMRLPDRVRNIVKDRFKRG